MTNKLGKPGEGRAPTNKTPSISHVISEEIFPSALLREISLLIGYGCWGAPATVNRDSWR